MPNKVKQQKPQGRKPEQPPADSAILKRLDKLTRNLPKGTFANTGAAIGSVLGPKGAIAGRLGGMALSAITGRGDYEVTSNTLARTGGPVQGEAVPKFVDSSAHSVRVTHREFFGNLVTPPTPTAFNNRTYVINPGNLDLFPWLGSIARNYTQYKIHGMVVVYKNTFSDYSAAGSMGSVVIATNYNVNDKQWPSKVSMENSEFAVSGKPSLHLMHPIECAGPMGAREEPYYVRDASARGATAVDDPRFYDHGLLQVATEGLSCASGTVLGEMWVSYDVEFFRPAISSGLLGLTETTFISNSNMDIGSMSASTQLTNVSSAGDSGLAVIPVSTTLPTPAQLAGAPAVVYLASSDTKICKFALVRPGQYAFTFACTGTGLATPSFYYADTGAAKSVVSGFNGSVASGGTGWTYVVTINVTAADLSTSNYTLVTINTNAATTITSFAHHAFYTLGGVTFRPGF